MLLEGRPLQTSCFLALRKEKKNEKNLISPPKRVPAASYCFFGAGFRNAVAEL